MMRFFNKVMQIIGYAFCLLASVNALFKLYDKARKIEYAESDLTHFNDKE